MQNYFTTLTLETNEQTLLQTVLPLHKIQVPSPPIVSEELSERRPLGLCKKKPTTTRTTTTTTNQRLCFKQCIDRNENVRKRCGPVWTSNFNCTQQQLLELHENKKHCTSPDDFQTFKLPLFGTKLCNGKTHVSRRDWKLVQTNVKTENTVLKESEKTTNRTGKTVNV